MRYDGTSFATGTVRTSSGSFLAGLKAGRCSYAVTASRGEGGASRPSSAPIVTHPPSRPAQRDKRTQRPCPVHGLRLPPDRRVARVRAFTYAERPDLAARTGEVEDTFAAFLGHGEIALRYWHLLRRDLPELQLVLWDEERDLVVGPARTIPARSADGLPGGVDDMLESWFGDGIRPEPDVLSAMVAVVDRRRQGEGLSRHLIGAMVDLAARDGFPALVAPVRPTWKDRYPLIPMERYASWKRDDGLPFDPWLRVHARLGAELLEVCPASMRVEGSADEWEP